MYVLKPKHKFIVSDIHQNHENVSTLCCYKVMCIGSMILNVMSLTIILGFGYT